MFMNFDIKRHTWRDSIWDPDQHSHKNECCDQIMSKYLNLSLGGRQDRYPDIKTGYKLLSTLCSVPEDNIYISHGSSMIIKDLISILEFDTIQTFTPGFELMDVYCGIYNKKLYKNSFRYDKSTESFSHEDVLSKGGDVLYITNPHCPTCFEYSYDNIIKYSKHFKYLIVDEAYTVPSNTDARVLEYDNIITVKTFSKIGGVPGIRLGYCYAHESIINKLMCVKPMYEITTTGVEYLRVCSPELLRSSQERLNMSAKSISTKYPEHYIDHAGNFCLIKNDNKLEGKRYNIDGNQFTRLTLPDPNNLNDIYCE